ncbi:MAG: hypothetical protein RLY86_1279 [Pseudomonadota bacterium]|jgi:uncharacterized membrane protein YGL010W
MSRLAEQMTFYAAYHQDARNKLTHVFGVPTIVFAVLLALACVPIGLPLGLTVAGVPVTLAMLFVAVMVGVYLWMDMAVGLVLTALTIPTLVLAHWVAAQDGTTIAVVFAATFIGGWIVQLIGHKFEGNKPALTQNLLQLFIAPLFLTAELFFALGLKKDVEAEVERRVKALGPTAGGRPVPAE